MNNFITKDSGKRQEYKSGMKRDLQEGKPRTDLIESEYLKCLVYTFAPEKLLAYKNFKDWYDNGDPDALMFAIYEAIKIEKITYWEFVSRLGCLLDRGAVKYGENNWQLANSEEELKRFRMSAHRHFMQWIFGEKDEDHLVAGLGFNPFCVEYVKSKINEQR